MERSAGGRKPSATKFMPATIEPTAKNCSNLTTLGLFGGRPNHAGRAGDHSSAATQRQTT
jgi:hypothetical protein